MGLAQHYAMTDRERDWIREQYGCGQVEFLERVGMVGEDVVLAHCSAMNAEEVAELAGSGTSVVHCPTGPAKMGSGVTPVRELLDAGINVCLGTDAAAANNGADLIRDLKWVAYLQKLLHRDATVVTAEQVLETATLGGAKALGMADLFGSIEAGQARRLRGRAHRRAELGADPQPRRELRLRDARAPTSTRSSSTATVLMEGRSLTTLDEERILAEARSAVDGLYARTGVATARRLAGALMAEPSLRAAQVHHPFPAERYLPYLTSEDVAALDKEQAAVVLVVGAIEQHGPHLATGTDLILGVSTLALAIERLDPSVQLGSCRRSRTAAASSTRRSPGTLTLEQETLARGDPRHRRERRALGLPPARALQQPRRQHDAARDGRARRAPPHRADGLPVLDVPPRPDVPAASATSRPRWGTHAGEWETSMMLHLTPELVDMERAQRATGHATFARAARAHRAARPDPVHVDDRRRLVQRRDRRPASRDRRARPRHRRALGREDRARARGDLPLRDADAVAGRAASDSGRVAVLAAVGAADETAVRGAQDRLPAAEADRVAVEHDGVARALELAGPLPHALLQVDRAVLRRGSAARRAPPAGRARGRRARTRAACAPAPG